MFSFDITDRNIRIIKGGEGTGKIRISAAATLNLEEEVIINGHVKDIPRLATLINQVLKQNKMADKEAIISISSNLTIFKELHIPKAEKPSEFTKMVKTEMQTAMGIDDQYSVSYIIVGNSVDEDGKEDNTIKVLATACPYEIIECYKNVFNMLSINLRSVIIGCNCITKVLLSDPKIKFKMPLLAVQIDNNFISLNLYEAGQMAFSRFASIDPADYDNSEDYVFEAVNENIFRMLQFHKNRKTGSSIEHVIFYGDTHEYIRLTNALEQMDIETSIITVPPQIHGYENLEFSLYANAIGAMFKRNKDTEHVNLLETDTVNNNKIKSNKSYGFLLGGVSVLSLLLVTGAWAAMTIVDNNIKKNVDELNSKIESPDTQDKLTRLSLLQSQEKLIGTYYDGVLNLSNAYATKPVVDTVLLQNIEKAVSDAANELKLQASITSLSCENGTISLTVNATTSADASSPLPAAIVDKLTKTDGIYGVGYEGYSIENKDDNGKITKTVNFSLTLVLEANEIPTAETTAVTEEADK